MRNASNPKSATRMARDRILKRQNAKQLKKLLALFSGIIVLLFNVVLPLKTPDQTEDN